MATQHEVSSRAITRDLLHFREVPHPVLFFFVLLFFVATPLAAQESVQDTLQAEDRWLAFDKVQHVAFSFLWVLSIQYVAVNKFDVSEEEAFPLSFATAALIGVIKEIYDTRKPGGQVSKRDLVANGVGLTLASAIVLTRGKN